MCMAYIIALSMTRKLFKFSVEIVNFSQLGTEIGRPIFHIELSNRIMSGKYWRFKLVAEAQLRGL